MNNYLVILIITGQTTITSLLGYGIYSTIKKLRRKKGTIETTLEFDKDKIEKFDDICRREKRTEKEMIEYIIEEYLELTE